jgi:hypothetical protein
VAHFEPHQELVSTTAPLNIADRIIAATQPKIIPQPPNPPIVQPELIVIPGGLGVRITTASLPIAFCASVLGVMGMLIYEAYANQSPPDMPAVGALMDFSKLRLSALEIQKMHRQRKNDGRPRLLASPPDKIMQSNLSHNGSSVWYNNTGQLICCSNASYSTPGVLFSIYAIPGKQHLLQVTGIAPKGNAYLYVGDSKNNNIVWHSQALLTEKNTVSIEFTAPASEYRLSQCSIGVLFSEQTATDTFLLDKLVVAPVDYEGNEFTVMAIAKSPIGGFYDFSKNGDCGFIKSRGLTQYTNNGQLFCRIDSTEQDSTPGPTKTVNFIEGRSYVFQVTGQASDGGKAWLWVEGAESTYYAKHLPINQEGTVSVQFVAQKKQQRIGVLVSGGISGQTFFLRQAIVAEW